MKRRGFELAVEDGPGLVGQAHCGECLERPTGGTVGEWVHVPARHGKHAFPWQVAFAAAGAQGPVEGAIPQTFDVRIGHGEHGALPPKFFPGRAVGGEQGVEAGVGTGGGGGKFVRVDRVQEKRQAKRLARGELQSLAAGRSCGRLV